MKLIKYFTLTVAVILLFTAIFVPVYADTSDDIYTQIEHNVAAFYIAYYADAADVQIALKQANTDLAEEYKTLTGMSYSNNGGAITFSTKTSTEKLCVEGEGKTATLKVLTDGPDGTEKIDLFNIWSETAALNAFLVAGGTTDQLILAYNTANDAAEYDRSINKIL